MLPLAADTALPVAPSHLEATADVVTPLAHPAVITPLLVTVAAMNRPHHPATVSVPPHAVVVAVAVAVAAVVAVEVVSHITVVVVAAVAVTGPPHHDGPLPRLTSTHHRVVVVVVVVAAVATVGAMTTPRPDAVGMRTTRTRVPMGVGLAAGGITMNPIEGVR